jgi:ribosomal protein L5
VVGGDVDRRFPEPTMRWHAGGSLRLDITFVTTARTDQEAYELLKEFGMPFVKRQEVLETAKA